MVFMEINVINVKDIQIFVVDMVHVMVSINIYYLVVHLVEVVNVYVTLCIQVKIVIYQVYLKYN